jgi:broad specificity phosphatase PhoE
MRLLIVRHGESYANAEGLIQGQGESPKFDLSARGRAQARACGERLDREGLKPTHVYASPLSRTAETARLIVERWGMDIEYWDDLMEHDMGSASGLTLAELSARHPDLDIALEGIRGFSGLPGAESLEARAERGSRAIHEVLRRHAQDDTVLLVSHGGIMQHIIRALLGSDRTWSTDIRNGPLRLLPRRRALVPRRSPPQPPHLAHQRIRRRLPHRQPWGIIRPARRLCNGVANKSFARSPWKGRRTRGGRTFALSLDLLSLSKGRRAVLSRTDGS